MEYKKLKLLGQNPEPWQYPPSKGWLPTALNKNRRTKTRSPDQGGWRGSRMGGQKQNKRQGAGFQTHMKTVQNKTKLGLTWVHEKFRGSTRRSTAHEPHPKQFRGPAVRTAAAEVMQAKQIRRPATRKAAAATEQFRRPTTKPAAATKSFRRPHLTIMMSS